MLLLGLNRQAVLRDRNIDYTICVANVLKLKIDFGLKFFVKDLGLNGKSCQSK